MDPTAALEGARMAADELARILDVDEYDGSAEGDEAIQNAAENLLINFRSLDDWLSQGGFLPEAWGNPRCHHKAGPGQVGSIGITGADGRMVWRFDYEHIHEYKGQKLVHSHDHHGPHGYFEHPEDVGAPVEPGYDTDVPYARKEHGE